jgi:hypothetical protein
MPRSFILESDNIFIGKTENLYYTEYYHTVLHVQLEPSIYVKLPHCVTCKISTLYYT